MSPRTHQQNQALRDATRAKIMDSALKLFSRVGYESASVRMIAREAGVAQGLMYSHFPGKQDLLKALFRLSMDDVRESFAAAEAPDARHPLERLIRSAFTIIRRNLDFWRTSYGVRMQKPVVKALGPELQSWTRGIIGVLEAHFRAAGAARPEIEAAILFACIDGICQHYVLDPRHYPLEAVADALVEKYAQGGRHGKKRAKSGD